MKLAPVLAGLSLAIVLLSGSMTAVHAESARHYRHRVYAAEHAGHGHRYHRYIVVGRRRPRGGYSMREREALWGPAEMPPAPHDFGPHQDFPAAPLNGGLTNSPYIH